MSIENYPQIPNGALAKDFPLTEYIWLKNDK
jgi:hypothetical protein